MRPLGICGIVAEFNPFHNGHQALIAAARGAGASHIVAVMSGNFVQRASFAAADKRVRAAAALDCGADLVIELPVAHATATARRFAEGAVTLLRACGIVDTLCFGSECGEAAPLLELARAVESAAVRAALKPYLDKGMTFARARQQAVREICGEASAALLSGPNNLLGVEYLYEAHRQGWQPRLFTIPRRGVEHDAAAPEGCFASASFLRRHAGDLTLLARYVPAGAFRHYRSAWEQGMYPADPRTMETAMLAHLRRLTVSQLSVLPELSEGLEHRLFAAIRESGSVEQLERAIKTKRYTLARVRRLILNAFLGVARADVETPPPYLRILGFTPRGRELLTQMKGRAAIPVDTSLSRLQKLGGHCARAAALEAAASDLYALALPHPPPCGTEYTSPGIYPRTEPTDTDKKQRPRKEPLL